MIVHLESREVHTLITALRTEESYCAEQGWNYLAREAGILRERLRRLSVTEL